MVVGPSTRPAELMESARLGGLAAAALEVIEARLGTGEDPRAVVGDVVGATFAPFGRSIQELADLTERLLVLLAHQR